ncbi:MAG: YHS domain-containing (seleno)protein [Chitinophagales bacterium]
MSLQKLIKSYSPTKFFHRISLVNVFFIYFISKYLFIIFLLPLLFSNIYSFAVPSPYTFQEATTTTFYIVRHTETNTNAIGEVSLSNLGQQRAKDLAEMLQSETINAIYTSYNTCDKETAKDVAKNKRIIINTYDSQQIESFLQRILQQRKGQNILIVGNLEVITTILQNLSQSFSPSSINQMDYSTLFEVSITDDNTTQITRIQYSQSKAIIGPPNNLTVSNQNLPEKSATPTKFSNNMATDMPVLFNNDETVEATETNTINSTATVSVPQKTIEEKQLPPLKKSCNLTKKGLMLLGYDPVAYFKSNKAIKGEEKHTTTYRSATFQFSSRKNLNTFTENPENYLPKYGGWCALGMSIEGVKDGYTADKYDADPENFKIIDGELYLFYKTSDYDALLKWNEQADESLAIERANKFWEQITNDE